MKFWKETLLTTIVSIGIFTSILYTACTQDACANLTCINGGSCLNGLCQCPTGYEGSTCQIHAADKFIGTYIGATSCNQGNSNIDTVNVTLVSEPNVVNVMQHSSGLSFQGTASGNTIQANVSGYNISIVLKDSLNLSVFISSVQGANTSNCTFVGAR